MQMLTQELHLGYKFKPPPCQNQASKSEDIVNWGIFRENLS